MHFNLKETAEVISNSGLLVVKFVVCENPPFYFGGFSNLRFRELFKSSVQLHFRRISDFTSVIFTV
jgi:hypothetical protein